jgi:hypothetical protein
LVVASSVIALVGGCARDSAGNERVGSVHIGPHGGFCVALPDAQGYAEVAVEEAPWQGQGEPAAQLVVFFLETDLKTPLAARPTDVSIKLHLPKHETEVLILNPEPKADDPAGSARFASAAGPFLIDEPSGLLSATIGSNSFTTAFSSAR